MLKKAFRFGVVTGGHASRSAWIALAQRVEELGYSSLLLPDVLGTPLATLTAPVAWDSSTSAGPRRKPIKPPLSDEVPADTLPVAKLLLTVVTSPEVNSSTDPINPPAIDGS